MELQQTRSAAIKSENESEYSADQVQVMLVTVKGLQSTVADLEKELTAEKENHASLTAEHSQLTASSATIKNNLEEAQAKLKEAEAARKQEADSAERLTRELDQETLKCRFFEEKCTETESALTAAKQSIQEKEANMKELVARINKLGATVADLERALSAQEGVQERKLADKLDEIEKAKDSVADYTLQLQVLREELATAKRDSDRAEKLKEEFESKFESSDAEARSACSRAAEAERVLSSATEELEELKQKYAVVADEVAEVQKEKEEALKAKASEIADLKSQLESKTNNLAAESEKVEFMLTQMADLRASANDAEDKGVANEELHQKLEKAVSENVSLQLTIKESDRDIDALKRTIREREAEVSRLQSSLETTKEEQDKESKEGSRSAFHVATIERQLREVVTERESGLQIIKQKCDEIDKLKLLIKNATPLAEGETQESEIEELRRELLLTSEKYLSLPFLFVIISFDW